MAYIVPAVLFVLAYLKGRSRLVLVFLLIYMWALVGLNTYTPDYAEYERVYNNPTIWDVEYGFRVICDICRGFGLTYQQFRMVFGALYIAILFRGIKKNTYYYNIVLAMYLLWPFVPGVSGLRFSFAVAVFFNAIPYLYEDKKFSIVKYIIWIGFSMLFHMGSILFLGYIFARKKYNIKQYIISVLLISSIALAIRSSLLESIALRLGISRLIKWLSNSGTEVGRLNIVGFTCYTIVLLANYCITSIMAKTCVTNCNNNESYNKLMGKENRLKRITVFSNINFLSLFIIPFFLVSSEYLRYFHATLMINYCIFGDFRRECHINNYDNRMIYCVVFVFVIIMTAAFYMYSQTSHDVLATFRDNILFQR